MNVLKKLTDKLNERQELEKKVIEQDLLAQIIRLSKKGDSYTYSITTHSPFEESETRVFEITAKEIK